MGPVTMQGAPKPSGREGKLPRGTSSDSPHPLCHLLIVRVILHSTIARLCPSPIYLSFLEDRRGFYPSGKALADGAHLAGHPWFPGQPQSQAGLCLRWCYSLGDQRRWVVVLSHATLSPPYKTTWLWKRLFRQTPGSEGPMGVRKGDWRLST